MKQKIRQLALPGFELADYIADSIDFLQKNEPQEGYFVGFSGGKDSIVTLDLVKLSGVKYFAGYKCTGIDYPEIPRFIRRYYPEVVFYSPEKVIGHSCAKTGRRCG